MNLLDVTFKKYFNLGLDNKPYDPDKAREELLKLAPEYINTCSRQVVYRKIKEKFGDNKDIKILDFGAGVGQTVFYLRLLGYKVYALNLTGRTRDMSPRFAKELNIDEDIFFEYNGEEKVPFESNTFDLVYSEQVLEHVHDLDVYYRETARILKPEGTAFFSFPHRLSPYDTHTSTWFAHYFPKGIRNAYYGYKILNVKHFNKLLNLRTVGHHKKKIKRYFGKWHNDTHKRIRSYPAGGDGDVYDGNGERRNLILRVFKIKFFGLIVSYLYSKISNVDLRLEQPK